MPCSKSFHADRKVDVSHAHMKIEVSILVYLDVEDINLAVMISCNCPFIEGIQSWQNQFPTGSDVIFTVSVSHVSQS